MESNEILDEHIFGILIKIVIYNKNLILIK